jgi:hypothetical protein
MRSAHRRVSAALVSLAAAAAVCVLGAAPADAQPVSSGSLSFSGDPGDYISGGQSYSYSTDAGDILNVSSDSAHSLVSVSVNAFNGDWWTLELAAPSGQSLTSGTYTGATRYPFNGAGPGLDLSGNGRGCNTLTGSFTVLDAVYGINGYVQQFDATFEQHCEGATEAARGEVHILNPPPPAPLAIDVTVASSGVVSTVSGRATVSGTVTCTKPVTVGLNGSITQIVKKVIVSGTFSAQVTCRPGASAGWTVTVSPSGTTPFQKGDAQVDAQATAYDADYGQSVYASTSSVTSLRKA